MASSAVQIVLYSTAAPRISLPAGATQTLVSNQPLPKVIPFLGATIGARLLDGNTGEVILESLCKTVPCH